MGVKPAKQYLPERHEVKHAYSDHAKVVKFFGEQAATPIEEGLARMAKWAKSAGIRKSKDFKDIEILKNLPPSWLEGR